MIIIGAIVLVTFGFLMSLLQRMYTVVPQYELKRLAAKRDALASALYRPASYGATLQLLLRILFVISVTLGLWILAEQKPAWVALVALATTFILSVIVIPSVRLTVQLAQFAAFFSGAISWVLLHTYKPLNFVTTLWYRFWPQHKHSGLYEKEDLIKLLDGQNNQPDNRILEEELQLTSHLLQFSDKQASDIMKPRSEVLMINENDTIGPLLLDRLHQAGSGLALVFRGKKNNVVGALRLEDALAARSGGQVGKFVQPNLLFVHEDYTLGQVLDAFRSSARPMAVVVNTAAEVSGAITLEDLLHQLVGPTTASALQDYSNPKTIAEYDPTKPIPEVAEVVEERTAEHDADSFPEATEVVE